MNLESLPHIALIGNPNCGKSTLFNRLTGLHQKTSNLPGTTVEQKSGILKINDAQHRLTDLPGIYSLYTQSDEERVVVNKLLGQEGKHKPQGLVFVIDASNLRRNLLLFSQVSELGIPSIAVLTMGDTAAKRGINIDLKTLSAELGIEVLEANPRTGEGVEEIRAAIAQMRVSEQFPPQAHIPDRLREFASGAELRGLSAETLLRYKRIETVVAAAVSKSDGIFVSLTRRFDRIFTHKIYGFLVFGLVMLTIFQGVFTLADYPMTWIETAFAYLGNELGKVLPDNFLGSMIVNGLVPGLAGVVVFLPQIAILFFFISLLEDSGYMVRASFITDNLMRRIGLNGRSVIPLIGGFACAIPGILATRSIRNRRERLATMFIIPLMSCSARLPVYVLLVSLAIPAGTRVGPIGLQSLIMTLAYFSGIIMAVILSKLYQVIRRKQETPGEFILEMPPYQLPKMSNVLGNVWYKSRSFLSGAGKIIILISLILWFLASYGPGDSMSAAQKSVETALARGQISETDKNAAVASARLEASFAGRMGKWIEPAIAPLGYDWKTGIALISSFAAREVFVGTMNTLFQTNSDKELTGIREKMQTSINPRTGAPIYGTAYALSLIVFYAFALQCVSTLAVMRRETGSWRLPVIQFLLFGAIAYVAAFAVYHAVIFLH